MKIRGLRIKNFLGIKSLNIKDIKDVVVISGQNGSGKSCIFDAVRLLKSSYGGYKANEVNDFFNEKSINLRSGNSQLTNIFYGSSGKLTIECDFELTNSEKIYLYQHSDKLVEDLSWVHKYPDMLGTKDISSQIIFKNLLHEKEKINITKEKLLKSYLKEMCNDIQTGSITIHNDGNSDLKESVILQVIFTNYIPGHLGIIDYHSAQRNFSRENIGGVNLKFGESEDRTKQHIIYNTNNKYNNIKSEMAENYVRKLFFKEYGGELYQESDIDGDLKDLFETFFPDKEFLGPKLGEGGQLSFSIKSKDGAVHDIDDLSSGEKEILYGYLRVKNSTFRSSIILLDEPELHLNPKLVKQLPVFYRDKLGRTLDNQIWLITHSDALIREVLDKEDFSAFHMQPAYVVGEESQLTEVKHDTTLEQLLTALVGDLATYHPGGKCILLEGGGTEFDRKMLQAIFPSELKNINLISANSRNQVEELHKVLSNPGEYSKNIDEFFAIIDRDSYPIKNRPMKIYNWDVYHIENYLLVDVIIMDITNSLLLDDVYSLGKVSSLLRDAASKIIPYMVKNEINKYINDKIVSLVAIDVGKDEGLIEKKIVSTIGDTVSRIVEWRNNSVELDELQSLKQRTFLKYRNSLKEGDWKSVMPGREVLKSYINLVNLGISYDKFRNMILNRIVEKKIKPEGMSSIINSICDYK